jgi:hypothetical protein
MRANAEWRAMVCLREAPPKPLQTRSQPSGAALAPQPSFELRGGGLLHHDPWPSDRSLRLALPARPLSRRATAVRSWTIFTRCWERRATEADAHTSLQRLRSESACRLPRSVMHGTLTVQQASAEWEAALADHDQALALQNTAVRIGADWGQFDHVIESTRLQLDLASARLRAAVQLDGGGGD